MFVLMFFLLLLLFDSRQNLCHNLPPCNYLPIYVYYNAALYLCYSSVVHSSGIIERPCLWCTHTSTGLMQDCYFLCKTAVIFFHHFVSMALHMVGKSLCP